MIIYCLVGLVIGLIRLGIVYDDKDWLDDTEIWVETLIFLGVTLIWPAYLVVQTTRYIRIRAKGET